MKLSIIDRRMLQLPDILLDAGMINYKKDFLEAIEMPRQNINNIKAGTQHFTVNHITKVCKHFKIDANWIFGLQHETPFQTVDKTLPKRKSLLKRTPM